MAWYDFLKAAAPIAASFIPGVGPAASAGLGAVLGAGGQAIGAATNAAANNRGQKFVGQIGLERLLMDRDNDFFDNTVTREREGRASGSDAWKKLLAAERTLNPGARPQLSPYSVAPRQAGADERAGADAMKAEVMARLQGGNSLPQVERRPMNVDPRLLDAGGMEKAGGWLSPILSMLAASRRQQPVMYAGNAPSGLTAPPRG